MCVHVALLLNTGEHGRHAGVPGRRTGEDHEGAGRRKSRRQPPASSPLPHTPQVHLQVRGVGCWGSGKVWILRLVLCFTATCSGTSIKCVILGDIHKVCYSTLSPL